MFEVAAGALPRALDRAQPAPGDLRELGRLRPRRPLRHPLDRDLRQAAQGPDPAARALPAGLPGAARGAWRRPPASATCSSCWRRASRSRSSRPRTRWRSSPTPAAGTAAWRAQLARAARAMHAGRSARLVDAGQLLDLIERALRAEPTTRAPARALHPARRDRDPRPRPRPYPHPAQRAPAAQRDPQDDRHGPRPRRSEPPAELPQRDQRADRPGRAGAHQLRLAAVREGDRQADLHDHRAAAQIRRRDPADPLPDRRMRDRLHAADRALLRAAVRGRGQGRDLAAVRDHERARAGRPGDRRGARRGELSRLCPAPRPAVRPDRLLGRRPLARPDRRGLRDRAAALRARPRAGADRASTTSSW